MDVDAQFFVVKFCSILSLFVSVFYFLFLSGSSFLTFCFFIFLLSLTHSLFFVIISLNFRGQLDPTDRMAAQNLHHVENRFFLPPPDTTPLGRIVNRFSGDLTTVDTAVAGVFSGTLLMFAQTVFNLGNIIAIFYYMAIPLVPLAIAYYKIQDFFRKSSVELQRLTSISKSPVLATFGEVLSGLATIRAYQVCCAPHSLVESQS